jgi:hypothetical protein
LSDTLTIYELRDRQLKKGKNPDISRGMLLDSLTLAVLQWN